MPTLAESLVGGAQQAAQTPGKSVGDAIQAYHISATAEHARQELEMQKQDQDMNKVHWLAGTMDSINRASGPTQKIMIDSLGPQIKQVYPNFDPANLQLMQKDENFTKNLSTLLQHAVSDPTSVDFGKLNDMLGRTAPEMTKMVDTFVQAQATKVAKEMMAQSMGQKNAVFEQKNAMAANENYSKTLGPMEDMIQSANRINSLIGQIKGRDLKSSGTMRAELGNALSSMFAKGSVTVSGAEEAQQSLHSLAGSAAERYGYVAGQPMNTITDAQLDQLSKEMMALKSEYSVARKNKFGSWVSGPGASDFAQPLAQRYAAFDENTSANPQQAQAQATPPTLQGTAHQMTYGQSPAEIKQNYLKFKAMQAHQQAGGNQ